MRGKYSNSSGILKRGGCGSDHLEIITFALTVVLCQSDGCDDRSDAD
jgi:hypothetical protein